MYTINDIADFLNVDRGFVRRIIESNDFRPTLKYGKEFTYSFYQIMLLQPYLEQLGQMKINIDIENCEIYSILESKSN